MKKILNLFSLFFTVISVCATALVCHILFIYPNINSNSPLKDKNISSFNTALMQNDNNTGIANSYQDNSSLPNIGTDDNIAANYQETPSVPQTEAEYNSNISAEYQSALDRANDYSNVMYMSQAAIYDQLTSEYGEHFPTDAAQYAIDNLTADYNFNALQKAKNYSDTMYMSKTAIYDQLISDYGEKFTPAEAQYAIDNLGADWNFNALQKAKDYQTTMNMSVDEIRNQLTSEYGERFTLEEANYAITNIVEVPNNNPSRIIPETTQNIAEVSQPAEVVPSSSYENGNNLNTYSIPNSLASEPVTDAVWLSATGEKYHSVNNCGRMNPDKARQVSIEYAVSRGYEKCEKCF